jgi:hypothetical protein
LHVQYIEIVTDDQAPSDEKPTPGVLSKKLDRLIENIFLRNDGQYIAILKFVLSDYCRVPRMAVKIILRYGTKISSEELGELALHFCFRLCRVCQGL